MDGPALATGGGEYEAGTGGQQAQQEAAAAVVDEQRMKQDLVSALERLPLLNPMSIASLLNRAEEEETAHAELTDAEIIKLVEDPYGE